MKELKRVFGLLVLLAGLSLVWGCGGDDIKCNNPECWAKIRFSKARDSGQTELIFDRQGDFKSHGDYINGQVIVPSGANTIQIIADKYNWITVGKKDEEGVHVSKGNTGTLEFSLEENQSFTLAVSTPNHGWEIEVKAALTKANVTIRDAQAIEYEPFDIDDEDVYVLEDSSFALLSAEDPDNDGQMHYFLSPNIRFAAPEGVALTILEMKVVALSYLEEAGGTWKETKPNAFISDAVGESTSSAPYAIFWTLHVVRKTMKAESPVVLNVATKVYLCGKFVIKDNEGVETVYDLKIFLQTENWREGSIHNFRSEYKELHPVIES